MARLLRNKGKAKIEEEGNGQQTTDTAALSPLVGQIDQQLQEMRKLTAAAAASIFRDLVVNLESGLVDAGHIKELLWQYAQTFDYHKYLNYQSYDEMQQKLNGIPIDGHTARAILSLHKIRKNWGIDFHTYIPWPVPAGEKLLVAMVRVSKSTRLSTFTAQIQEIITRRVNGEQRPGARRDNVLMHSDMVKYHTRYPKEKPSLSQKRKHDEAEDKAPGNHDMPEDDETEDGDVPEEAEQAGKSEDGDAKLAATATREMADTLIPRDVYDADISNQTGSPMSVEKGRRDNHIHQLYEEPSGSLLSPLRSWLDGNGDGHSSAGFDLSPATSAKMSYVDLDESPDPPLTSDDLHTSLRAAIQNLSGTDRLNDETVNACLQWEAKRVNTTVTLKSSFFLDIAGDWDHVRTSASRRTLKPPPYGKFLVPVHHPATEHWTLLYVDFKMLSIDHYDPQQTTSRFSSVTGQALKWMTSVDKSINANDIQCCQKVTQNSHHPLQNHR
jgi:hypothetical protein